jgi:hypothetical protein
MLENVRDFHCVGIRGRNGAGGGAGVDRVVCRGFMIVVERGWRDRLRATVMGVAASILGVPASVAAGMSGSVGVGMGRVGGAMGE